MESSVRKSAISKIIGLAVGERDGAWVVKDGEEWRELSAPEIVLVDAEYAVLYRESLVPKSITKVQAMLQLKALSLWSTFAAFLASNADANDIWMLALSVDRDNAFIPVIAAVVGWDDVATDNFFIEAGKL